MKILVIIPARSGSKAIPHKNIKEFSGKPLLAWSIHHALQSTYSNNMKIVVSTDSEKYAAIARQYGAETPFIRPKEISGDYSTDFECINHCVQWLQKNENYESDIILHLRPTQPCRKVEDIDKCIKLFWDIKEQYDSLRSVVLFDKSPYKMYSVNENNTLLSPLYKEISGINEPYNQCRQILPKTYLHNGYIDIIKTDIINKNTISGDKIYPYIMYKTDTIDIDTMDDWLKAENEKI